MELGPATILIDSFKKFRAKNFCSNECPRFGNYFLVCDLSSSGQYQWLEAGTGPADTIDPTLARGDTASLLVSSLSLSRGVFTQTPCRVKSGRLASHHHHRKRSSVHQRGARHQQRDNSSESSSNMTWGFQTCGPNEAMVVSGQQ